MREKTVFSDNYILFLRLLRAARSKAGLTQEQLADRLGEKQTFVSRCERGERRLDIVEVRAFCVALEISFPAFVADFDRAVARRR